MIATISCKYCKKNYKNAKWLEKHLEKNHNELERQFNPNIYIDEKNIEKVENIKKVEKVENIKKVEKIKKNKQKIPIKLRNMVWTKYVGNTVTGICFCCRKTTITSFSGERNTFEAGHIKSEYDGGEINIDNLLPICKKCNRSMNVKHWDFYVNKNHFPLRIYGGEISQKTHNFVTLIQKYWRKKKAYEIIRNLRCEIKKKKRKKRKKRKKYKKYNYLNHTISSMNKLY